MSGSTAECRRDPGMSGSFAARSMSEATPTASDDMLEWCVERSGALCAMTWTELWQAIVDGDVRRGARVWREGLECWTPVEAVPELAGAFTWLSTLDFEVAFNTAVTPPAVEIAPLPPPPDLAPGASGAPASSVRPVAWDARAPRPEAPVRVGARSFLARLVSDLVSARWTAAGAVVAAVSIGASVSIVSAPPHRANVTRARFQASSVVEVIRQASASLAAASARATALPPSEPGQRRLRSGRRTPVNAR